MLRRPSLIFLIFLHLLKKSHSVQLLPTDYLQLIDVFMNITRELPHNECTEQLLSIGNAFIREEMWALKMLDATAKPQAGILLGNLAHVGNYDECLEIDEELPIGTKVQGQYCSVVIQPHPTYRELLGQWSAELIGEVVKHEGDDQILLEARLSYGVCVPKACTVEHLQTVADAFEISLQLPAHFNFVEDFCDVRDGKKFTTSAIITIVIFSGFAALLLLGTLYDVLLYSKRDDEEKSPNLLVAFSMATNGKKLLATSISRDTLKCLDGLRVVSMMWIVLSHGVQFSFLTAHINSRRILDWKDEINNVFIMSTSLAVDTFFTISGLLVTYLFLKGQTKGIRFSLPMFYIHRLLRLTPSLAMMVLFTTNLLVYIGDGPFWPVIKELCQKPCEKNWWATLLYLQNYIHTDEQCIGQAWYLAADTQMFIFSPLVFFPLMKWPKQTIGAIFLIIALNCSYVFEITWKKHLGTTYFNQDAVALRYIYNPSHVRGAVYLIGMVCGYIVHKTKRNTPLKLTPKKVKVAWMLSLLVMVSIALAHSVMVGAKNYDVLNSSIFNSLTRVGWALALSIIIILCVNGYGGLVNSFLANHVFTVLYRLNYSIYVVHLNMIVLILAQGRTPEYFSEMTGYHRFWGNYMFTIGASIIWTLAFESPIVNIEKLIFGKGKNLKKTQKTIKQNKNEDTLTVKQITIDSQ